MWDVSRTVQSIIFSRSSGSRTVRKRLAPAFPARAQLCTKSVMRMDRNPFLVPETSQNRSLRRINGGALMRMQVTARHFKANDELNTYVAEHVTKLQRYYDGITSAKVVLERLPMYGRDIPERVQADADSQ